MTFLEAVVGLLEFTGFLVKTVLALVLAVLLLPIYLVLIGIGRACDLSAIGLLHCVTRLRTWSERAEAELDGD